MPTFTRLTRVLIAAGTVVGVSSFALSGVAQAATTSSSATTTNQQRLNTIISKGDQEISRRLSTLSTLGSKINAAAKLSASDKSYLASEVSTEVSGLTSLKTKLDADTDLTTARTDAQSIINEYRVYALVVPKVMLVKTADDQQVVEAKLTSLAQKLQTRITAAQTAGKAVTSLQTELDDMTMNTNAAQGISSSIEQKVLTLQPSDYDTDHTILSGDSAQLQTAHSDNVAAYNDAKSIVTALQNL